MLSLNNVPDLIKLKRPHGRMSVDEEAGSLDTTQCHRPGLEPGPLDPKTSAFTKPTLGDSGGKSELAGSLLSLGILHALQWI